MPSQTTSWITEHGELCLLHVTSTDPRRKGVQDLAVFERDLLPIIKPYRWVVRHGQIENEHGKSLLGQITSVRKMGTVQLEPNCDFTKDNIGKRPAPIVDGTALLKKFREDNADWKQIQWERKHGCPMFKPIRYRNRDEWTVLTVELSDGGTLDIKVNKWLVSLIPTKLVYRPKRPYNQLYLLPNSAQLKRQKHDNDRRHGMALTSYILEATGGYDVKASRLRDRFDYRLDSTGDFIQSCNPKNTWHKTSLGTVLQVTLPEGYARRAWDNIADNIEPKQLVIPARAERVGYFLLADHIAEQAKDFSWVMDSTDVYCSRINYEHIKGSHYKLAKFVCELSGIRTNDITQEPRLTKYYAKALEGTTNRALASRAKFENALPSEKRSSNRMYVDGKFISHRRIYAEQYVKIPELNKTALDLRVDSLRVGGRKSENNNPNV